jgi:flagellar biosynthesis protein FlhB
VEAALAMLVLGLPDYLFQRKQYRDSLKMTKHEVKEERKMHEGDPLVQNRLRERMREILSRNIMKSVPEADVVITNPTHYAVALEWDRLSMTAPMVTAKGQDHLAQRIKEIAGENEVPVIENKPLARALYAEVDLGDVIPEKYYEVMAGVLAQVYKMQGRGVEAVS